MPGRPADLIAGKYALDAEDCKLLATGKPFSKELVGAISQEVLTPEGITSFTMRAVADVASSFEIIPDLAAVLGGCNPAGQKFLIDELPRNQAGKVLRRELVARA